MITPYILLIGRQGGIKMASANEPKGLILVHTEKLNPRGLISGNLVSSGISHIAFASALLVENMSEEVDDYDNYYPRAQASRIM